MDSPPLRYGPFGQLLHWGIAALVLVAFIYGPGGSETRVYSVERDFERSLHETLGIAVLTLAMLRLLWRGHARRPDPPQVPRWMGITAKILQWMLYVLMFAVPLTAICGAWLEGHPLTLLGGVRIAPPWAEAHAVGAKLAELHTWLGDVVLWVAGFHAMAGLFHHFVLHDDVMVSMLPSWLVRR